MDGITPFLDRASEYSAARPPYSSEALDLLVGEFNLRAGSMVADIGSGTGVFTKQLLRVGASVYAVEPNPAMRAEAEAALCEFPEFRSVDAPAEALPFADGLVDGITCAQSFHWFDVDRVGPEFLRVAKPSGWFASLWNRLVPGNAASAPIKAALNEAYESSGKVLRQPQDLRRENFPFLVDYRVETFAHIHRIRRDDVRNLVRSRSYWTGSQQDREEALLRELPNSAELDLTYETEIHFGRFAPYRRNSGSRACEIA